MHIILHIILLVPSGTSHMMSPETSSQKFPWLQQTGEPEKL